MKRVWRWTNLRISDRAVILPYYIELDRLQEEAKGDNKIQATIRESVLPMDKAARVSIPRTRRMEYFQRALGAESSWKTASLKLAMKYSNQLWYYFEEYAWIWTANKAVCDRYFCYPSTMRWIQGKRVLLKGAQGLCWILTKVLIHLTSSNPGAGGVPSVPVLVSKIDKVVGVCKAYRFGRRWTIPKQGADEVGDHDIGHEYGTTTVAHVGGLVWLGCYAP